MNSANIDAGVTYRVVEGGQIGGFPTVRLRRIASTDMDFMRVLYASTREAELAPVPWPDEIKQQFLMQQFDLQHRHYQSEFSQAEFLLIEDGPVPIGRFYLDRAAPMWSVIDIALIAERRGRGLGTALMEATLQDARDSGCPISLYAEPNNPARHLYERLGFRLVGEHGVYGYYEWRP